jgi:hypothetical protein
MALKKIFLENGVSIIDWLDINEAVLINSLYDNIFEFMDSELENDIVLRVENSPNSNKANSDPYQMIFEFSLVKEDIPDIIHTLMEYFETIEDYEKCSELVKLKHKLKPNEN